jgi:hypothetical protein
MEKVVFAETDCKGWKRGPATPRTIYSSLITWLEYFFMNVIGFS